MAFFFYSLDNFFFLLRSTLKWFAARILSWLCSSFLIRTWVFSSHFLRVFFFSCNCSRELPNVYLKLLAFFLLMSSCLRNFEFYKFKPANSFFSLICWKRTLCSTVIAPDKNLFSLPWTHFNCGKRIYFTIFSTTRGYVSCLGV